MLDFQNQGKRVKMIVEEYTTTIKHNGRRGSPAIPTGTKVYVIRYEIGGYYTYSFLHEKDAHEIIETMRQYGTDNEYHREWNLVDNPEKTMHYGKVGE